MSTNPMQQRRFLLKLSGEQLAGDKHKTGIDATTIGWLANEVQSLIDAGVQVVIVAGAGNWIRGAEMAGNGIERSTADYMGMLAGIINGQALMDIFQSHGIETRVMSSIRMEQICEPYIRRKAIRHLEKGRVVIVSGGTGRPFFTHDTAAVTYGLELDCDLVIKATNVDGVYDRDPETFSDATLLPELSHQQAIENPNVAVMDKAALGLAMENKIPIVVYNLHTAGALVRIAQNEPVGTRVATN